MNHELDGIATPADPSVAPDGSRVSFTVTTVDVEEDRYVRVVWMADSEGARPFTSGPGDSAARFSPDGRHLAFLRVVDGVPQLAVLAVNGGEARVLTEFGAGVAGEPVWSPDSSTVAVVGIDWAEGWEDLTDEERARRPRVITRRDYRGDGVGWTHDRHRRVYLVAADGSEVRRLTGGDRDESLPAWSPDASRLAYAIDDSEVTGFDFGTSVFEAEVATGDTRQVAPRGQWSSLSYRPDGTLFALGAPGTTFPEPAGLWRLGGDPECLSPGIDRPVSAFGAGTPWLVWDGDVAVVALVDSGAIGVVRIGPDGETEIVHRESDVVNGFDQKGATRAMTISAIGNPGRVVIEGPGGVTEHSDFGGRSLDLVEPDHFVVEGEGADLDVWVYLPEGEGPVPLLLNIHGGPASQYGWGFFDEFQVYVDAGYGVVATNPRGSTGRDAAFLKAVRGEGWGTVDVADIDAVVAAALDRHPRLDSERMGVMGGSYGGFLTAWLIGHQSRWRSAIVERALLAWPSFRGTSDIGGWFGDEYVGNSELEWDRSPLRIADRVTTPTLIIHSEGDYRCPIEQAEQYFSALLQNGVETEFVRFPGEGHELSRSGKPRHREERFQVILDWLERTLD